VNVKKYFEQRFCEALDSDWPIVVAGNEYQSSDVLRVYAPHDYDSYFTEWLEQQKTDARQRVRDSLLANGCLMRFNRLAERTIAGQVLPFVGAGMSKPSGFALWNIFLKDLASEDPALVPRVDELMRSGDFERAAQCIADRFNVNMLAEQVENYFGCEIFEVKGSVSLLPLLLKQGCVTTNFDVVLEKTYRENDLAFLAEYAGEDVKRAPRDAANGRHVIFKIHGRANDDRGRVLTSTEYDRAYGVDDTLAGVLNYLISNRSLLFLGCSLCLDRTVQALRAIKMGAGIPLPRHYAFLKDPGPDARPERREGLEQAEIHPIWYSVEDGASDHDSCIEDLLVALAEGPIDE
jgi:hypothetical protein